MRCGMLWSSSCPRRPVGRAPAKRLAGPGPLVNPAQVMIDIDRLQAKRSLAAFVRMAWPIIEPNEYVHGWHIDALCEHLEAITDGVELPDGSVYNRLLVNIPPGTAKSMIVSVLWPCWEWGPAGKPHSRFLCVSHSQRLAVRDNMRSRRLLMSDWYQARWPIKMVSDQNEKMKFENDQGGWREAAAAGSITGSRGDRGICLPYESMVLSSEGWLPIGEIVERRLPVKIAGTDGRTIEWQGIEAYETNPGRPLVRINDSLECTPDHRVWVLGRGWVEAQNVVVGDTLYEINAGAVRELLGSSPQDVLLPAVLPPIPDFEIAGGEQQTVRGVRGAGLQIPGAPRAGGEDVLLGAVLGRGQQRCEQPSLVGGPRIFEMPPVRRGVSPEAVGGEAGQVVLPDVLEPECLGPPPSPAAREALPPVRRLVQAARKGHEVLFKGLRGRGACSAHEGRGERAILARRGREALPAGLEPALQGVGESAGRRLLRGMRLFPRARPAEPPRPSHRLQQEQSSTGEPGNGLSPLPREYARVTGAAIGLDAVVVRSVGESARRVERTYNVRVAPFHNYFAGGVLVHNCDDPHSVEGAASEQMRQTTIEWFLEALPTRMNDPIRSSIVVIMQRLHEEDVAGVILEKKLGYDHLCLPMRATLWRRAFPTLLGYVDPRTEEGELLFPERFPEEVVKRDEKVMGQYAVAGQFQQEPAPRGGGVIKREWWKPYLETAYPPMSFIIASLDTAYTEKTENDPSALTVWGVTTGAAAMYASRYVAPGGRLKDQDAETAKFDEAARVKFRAATQGGDLPRVILMDAWTDRLELHELVEKVTKTCRKMKVDKLLIENKASGYSVAQEIRRLFSHENWAVQLLDPLGQDKLARLYSVQHLFEEGMIYAPDKVWADQVITQAAVFPKGKHDDLVDTTSMALRHLRELGLLTRAPEWTSDIYESMKHSGKPPGPIYPA